MAEATFVLLVLTWCGILVAGALLKNKFHQHTTTIKNVHEWTMRMLDEMTKPKA